MSERVGRLLCVMTLLFCHITLGERFSKKEEGEGIWVECFVPPENVQKKNRRNPLFKKKGVPSIFRRVGAFVHRV